MLKSVTADYADENGFINRTLNNQLSTINGLDCRQNSGVVFEIKFLALANRATILRELQCALLR